MHRPLRDCRSGYSLLELILAVALVGGTLVPALALLRDGLELSRATDERQLLANYAVQKLEEQLAAVANNWASAIVTGDLAAEGYPALHFQVIASDNPTDGGIANELMHVQAIAFIDADNDNAPDATETQCVYRTKIANLPYAP